MAATRSGRRRREHVASVVYAVDERAAADVGVVPSARRQSRSAVHAVHADQGAVPARPRVSRWRFGALPRARQDALGEARRPPRRLRDGCEDEGHRAAPARRHRCDREGRDETAVGRCARKPLPVARSRRREGAGARRLHPRADDRRFVRPAHLLRVPRRASEARWIVDHADRRRGCARVRTTARSSPVTRTRCSTTRCSRRCAPSCRKVMRSPSRRIVATGRPTRHGRA